MNRLLQFAVIGSFAFSAALVSPLSAARADDDFGRRASWTAPTLESAQAKLAEWVATGDEAQREAAARLWQPAGEEAAEPASRASVLDRFAATVELLEPKAAEFVAATRKPREGFALPTFDVLADESIPAAARNNLRLLHARWLLTERAYNETLETLAGLNPDDVIDPASLLYYRGVANYQLIKKDECIATIDVLLENEDALPVRYREMAGLMKADIAPLEIDSLDEVARLMDNIGIRLAQAHAGARVRKEQQDVIDKLDKKIEELEEQQKKNQQGSQAGQNQGNQPKNESQIGGPSGEGNVDKRNIAAGESWGNLPPEKRAEALQNIGRDYPSHYRDVIEEYFRKLARDGVE